MKETEKIKTQILWLGLTIMLMLVIIINIANSKEHFLNTIFAFLWIISLIMFLHYSDTK